MPLLSVSYQTRLPKLYGVRVRVSSGRLNVCNTLIIGDRALRNLVGPHTRSCTGYRNGYRTFFKTNRKSAINEGMVVRPDRVDRVPPTAIGLSRFRRTTAVVILQPAALQRHPSGIKAAAPWSPLIWVVRISMVRIEKLPSPAAMGLGSKLLLTLTLARSVREAEVAVLLVAPLVVVTAPIGMVLGND